MVLWFWVLDENLNSGNSIAQLYATGQPRARFINRIFFMMPMKFNEDLAAVHGYLCADGYVVRNHLHQKHKYYRAGLRNMNVILLMDFQKRFKNYFGVSPKIYRNERCDMHSKLRVPLVY